MAGELENLCLAAGEGGHRLAPASGSPVRQGAQDVDVRMVREELGGLGDGHVQNIGDGHWLGAHGGEQLDLRDLGAVTAPVAVRAAQVDIAQELHLHVFETLPPQAGQRPVPELKLKAPAV